MSNYAKFDQSIIKNRIKEGTYDTLIGANRAIGKTQGLSEEDRAALKKFAAKHFGVEAPVAAPAKKKAAKVVKKAGKTAKAPRAKKTAKRAAKKAPKSAPAAEPAPAATEVAQEEASAPVKKTRKKRGSAVVGDKVSAPLPGQLTLPFNGKAAATPQERADTVSLMGQVIGTCSDVLTALKVAEELYPKGELAESVATTTLAMTQAVSVMQQVVISPLIVNGPVASAKVQTKSVPPKSTVRKRSTPVTEEPAANGLGSLTSSSVPPSPDPGNDPGVEELNGSESH